MFIPRYITLSDVMVNGIAFLISLSDLLLVNRKETNLYIFVSCNFSQFIDKLSSFSGSVFRIFYV